MEWVIIKEKATRYAMIKNGEVDLSTLMTDVFMKKLLEDPKLRVINPASSSTWTVINTAQWNPKSPWADVRVRKAASLALDRQSLADIHCPGGAAMGTIGLTGGKDVVARAADPYDPAAAKKLLAEAGYPNGLDGGIFHPYPGGYVAMGEQMANYWKAVGINVKVTILDKSILLGNRKAGKLTNRLFVDSNSFPTIAARLNYQLGPAGYGNYPEIEAVWKKYNKSADAKERHDIITKVQKMLYEKYQFIPVAQATSPAGIGPRVKGDPYGIKKPFPIWFVSPLEDLQLK
jgi:peptide/nickel transport system substrate-binding protein